MTGAFGYLILTSARNRARTRLARLRNPRYAIALALGAAYLWLVYLRPRHRGGEQVDVLGGPVIALLPLLLLAYVGYTWIFGADRNALAFSQAEVTHLFSAPVPRRALVLYKVARTQIAIVTTSIVWTLILRRVPSWPIALTHLASYWVLLSALGLNRLGVAMIRASGADHGARGVRRHWASLVVIAVIVLMVALPVVRAWPRVAQAESMSLATDAVVRALEAPSAWWALLPFRLVLAPLAAPPGLAWVAAMGPALLLLAGLLLWVLRTDAVFEEAAVEASAREAQRLATLRARRAGTGIAVPRATRTLPLSPAGAPAVALVWKNAMWVLRTGQLRSLLLPPAIAFATAVALAPRMPTASISIAVVCGVLALFMLFLGPMTMRNDLRSELLHLSLLKTYPLRGRDVVLAEVVSSALPLALMQYLLGLAALAALALGTVVAIPPGLALALVAGTPVLLAGLNIGVCLIHNALALLFPGWVRLGTGGPGGVETLGLGMISVAFTLLMLGVMLIVPALALAAIVVLLWSQLPIAIVAGGLVAGGLLIAESVAGAWSLGGSLDRVEPMGVEG